MSNRGEWTAYDRICESTSDLLDALIYRGASVISALVVAREIFKEQMNDDDLDQWIQRREKGSSKGKAES